LTSSPTKIIDHYNLCNIVTPDGWVCIEIKKGMYGFPKPASSQINYSKNALPSKGITNANILLSLAPHLAKHHVLPGG
jgi:hypothetical protein